MAISLAELTNGTTVVKEVDGLNTYTWQGTAVFDVLVRMVNENLKIQYDEGRIKATDYAGAYIEGLQTCIVEAMKFIMQKDIANKEIELKQAQINVADEEKRLKAAQADAYPLQVAKDNQVKDANIALLNRQKEGFDDNKHQKLFEAQMNAWALMFSSGILETKPQIITDDKVSALYNTLSTSTPTP